MLAIGSWHSGAVSNGSAAYRQRKAWSTDGVNVAPNWPVPYRIESMLCFGMPNGERGVRAVERRQVGPGTAKWCPFGISE